MGALDRYDGTIVRLSTMIATLFWVVSFALVILETTGTWGWLHASRWSMLTTNVAMFFSMCSVASWVVRQIALDRASAELTNLTAERERQAH